MSDTGNSRFTGTGSKTVCPPVRPCATDGLYLIGIVRLYIFDKLAGNCRAEFGPFVFLIPLHQHLATLCRRGRIIGKITGVLGGNDIVRIVPGFHFTQIIQDAFFELLEVIGVDTEEVSLVVMFGTISQHLFPGRRLPPEYGRYVETDQGTMAVCSHIYIFHTCIGKKFSEAPTDTVHIVLHSDFRFHSCFTEGLQRVEGGGQCLFVGQFVEVQIHGSQFDASFGYPLFQAGDLFGRAAFQVFADSPGDFAGPAKLGKVGVIIGSVAIVERIVDVAEMFCQDFSLRTGVTNIGMRMLHHIHLPVTDRFYFHPGRFLFLTDSYCQRQLHGRLYLRYLKKEGIRPVIQFHFPGLIAQGNRCIGGGSFVFYRNPYFLYRAFCCFIQSGKEMRLDPRRSGRSAPGKG